MRENRFQISVATGRITLPVAILFCLIVWILSMDKWLDLATLGITALTGYLMIEANTTLALIRTRTTLPVSLYATVLAACVFLHSLEWDRIAPLAFLLAVIHLYRSYESPHASTSIFHAFFFLALGSMAFAQLLYFIPLFLCSTWSFRSLSVKTICAALLGMAAPYWVLTGYACLYEDWGVVIAPWLEMVDFSTISHTSITTVQGIAWGVVTVLQVGGSICYMQTAYQDKTRTRLYMRFLLIAGWWATAIIALQPQHLSALLPVQVICTSFLTAHWLTLTRNRISNISLIVIIIAIVLLTVYNLWMQFFNS